MDSLRVVLMLVGVVVIAGLIVQGMLTLRRNNQAAQENKAVMQRKRAQQQSDLLDGVNDSTAQPWGDDDFDQLGLGKVRSRSVKASRNELAASTEPNNDEPTAAVSAGVAQQQAQAAEQQAAEALAEQPLRAAQTAAHDPELPSVRAHRDDGSAEQMAIDLAAAESAEEAPEPPEETVITLFVSGDIKGAALLETVTELGMKFGELDIFHRYEQPNGRGPLLFRMANMYNPGTFDLDNMDSFDTRGVVLFMALPIKYDGHKAFTMMYNAANKIAEAMPRAAVLDGNRNPMTKQSVQHTYQKIREFERQMRLAGLR